MHLKYLHLGTCTRGFAGTCKYLRCGRERCERMVGISLARHSGVNTETARAAQPRAQHLSPVGTEPPSELSGVVERNLEALLARRQAEEKSKNLQDRLADRVTDFAGSMRFV